MQGLLNKRGGRNISSHFTDLDFQLRYEPETTVRYLPICIKIMCKIWFQLANICASSRAFKFTKYIDVNWGNVGLLSYYYISVLTNISFILCFIKKSYFRDPKHFEKGYLKCGLRIELALTSFEIMLYKSGPTKKAWESSSFVRNPCIRAAY